MEKATSNDLRVRKTRANIKNTLAELLKDKKLSDITISELSEAALINRKTFYYHYDSVRDVLNDIENDLVQQFMSAIRSNHISVMDLRGIISQNTKIVVENRELISRITKNSPDLFGNGRLFKMLKRTFLVYFKNNTDLVDPKERDYTSTFLTAGIITTYEKWFEDEEVTDPDRLTEVIEQLITHGLISFNKSRLNYR